MELSKQELAIAALKRKLKDSTENNLLFDDFLRKLYDVPDRPHNNPYTWLVGPDKKPDLITKRDLRKIMIYAPSSKIYRFIGPLNKAMHEFNITTSLRIAAFLAQIAHESGSLLYEEEIASGAAYEGRRDLGNVNRGDGIRYKGRGLIQLTGRANYRKVGEALGLPLEENPNLVKANPYVSARVAGYFWESHGLNELADLRKFRKITLKINGGLNGYDDRLKYYRLARDLFNV